jgi:imidazolonepropionase-like amidohydrolase
MILLVEAGLTPAQVITVATSNAANALGLVNYGVIAPGNVADLLVLDSDPTADITNTKKIFSVYKAGVKIK